LLWGNAGQGVPKINLALGRAEVGLFWERLAPMVLPRVKYSSIKKKKISNFAHDTQ
jgi:hypothetical protein